MARATTLVRSRLLAEKEEAAAAGALREVLRRDPRYELTSEPGEPLTARVRHSGEEYLYEVRAMPQGS